MGCARPMAPGGADFDNVQSGRHQRQFHALCFVRNKILRLKKYLPMDSDELKVQGLRRWVLNV